MVDTIEKISEIGFSNVIISVLLISMLVVGFISLKDELFEKMGIVTKKSLKDAKINKRLDDIEHRLNDIENNVSKLKDGLYTKQDEYHEESIQIRGELNQQLKQIMDTIQLFMDRENENTVAQFRSSLWRMHKDFVQQKFVTPDGLKTFLEMGAIYERCGGNDIYHDKLKPEVEALEVHYPVGSIYNK